MTIGTDNLFVDVLEGKELVTSLEEDIQKKQPIVSSGKNFRYIQTKTILAPKKSTNFYRSYLFYILIISSLLLIPIAILIGKNNEKRKLDVVGLRLRKAEKLAKKYLSEAQKQLGKKEAFYEALERALHNYLKAKLGVETTDISKENITQILEKRTINNTTINQFIEVLKASDFARYTPVTDTEMKQEYEKAKQIIIALDKQL